MVIEHAFSQLARLQVPRPHMGLVGRLRAGPAPSWLPLVGAGPPGCRLLSSAAFLSNYLSAWDHPASRWGGPALGATCLRCARRWGNGGGWPALDIFLRGAGLAQGGGCGGGRRRMKAGRRAARPTRHTH